MKIFLASFTYGFLVIVLVFIVMIVSGQNIGIFILPFIFGGYFLILGRLKNFYGPQSRKTKLIIASGLIFSIFAFFIIAFLIDFLTP